MTETTQTSAAAVTLHMSRLDTAAAALTAVIEEEDASQIAREQVAVRMTNHQERAESIALKLAVEEAEEIRLQEVLTSLDKEEQAVKCSYNEALEVLEAAKVLVREQRQMFDDVRNKKNAQEIEMAPACIKSRATRVEYTRCLLLAEAESAEIELQMASLREKIVKSKLAVAEAKLELLGDPQTVNNWPTLKGILHDDA